MELRKTSIHFPLTHCNHCPSGNLTPSPELTSTRPQLHLQDLAKEVTPNEEATPTLFPCVYFFFFDKICSSAVSNFRNVFDRKNVDNWW